MVLFSALVPAASAEEIVISGNGADSVNQAVSSTNQETNVTQSNTADVNNDVETTANTGNNTASDNTGGNTEITTGDVSTSTEIANSANVSTVNGGSCDCPTNITTTISGNGPGSQNTVTYSGNSHINIGVNQVANITNNVATNANTGNNQANGNTGNVTIKTGGISVINDIINGPINISKIKIAQGLGIDALLKIAGNGTSSLNSINISVNSDTNIAVNNLAEILNNLALNLNTGGNTADSNVGDVKITTGDIWAQIKIKNLANVSEVIVDCGCKQKPGEEKPPILPPGVTTTPPSTGGGDNPPGSSGVVQGATSNAASAVGNMLPATGGNWLFFALLGNILMFLLGAYLRLRSGRGPGFALAI